MQRPYGHPWPEPEDGADGDASALPTSDPAALHPSHARPERGGGLLHELVQIVLPAVLLAMIVHLFLAQATVVYGQSMEPNLSPFQRLIVDKLTYHFRAPERNDIVVLELPDVSDLLVKRIVALPGESIEIDNGEVYVNGVRLDEPFLRDLGHVSMARVRLGPLQYFVMGDNRDNSNDSRTFGPVMREQVVGRVWVRYWPLDDFTFF